MATAQRALAEKRPVDARKAVEAAHDDQFDNPDPERAAAEADLMAQADAAIIEKAVESQAMRAGDDLGSIRELHGMHIRLRGVGGNDKVAAKIVEAINIHASLAMQPHEATSDLTDVKPLFELARYPELNDDNRKRLKMLSGKAWRVLNGRATAAKHPLLAREFAGLAASYSGDALDSGDALVQTELAPYRRGTVANVTLPPDCTSLASLKTLLDQKGAFQVDTVVALTNCQRSSYNTSEAYDEEYFVDIPYTAHEVWQDKVCNPIRAQVYYCENPYLNNGCVASAGETVASYECHEETREADVTRYRHEKRTRKATRTITTYTWSADATWTRAYNGTSESTTATLSFALRDRQEDSAFAASAATQIATYLDQPVIAAVNAKVAELRAAGEQAIAAGSIDDGEVALVRVALLGGDPTTYFAKKYLVSPDEMRDAFKARAKSPPADKLVATESLPDITHVRKTTMVNFALARFNSTFAPELAQIEGLYYTTGFGTLVTPTKTINGDSVGGGFAPVFSPRVGTAVIARLLRKTAGLGLWDDASIIGAAGYAAGKDTDGARGFSGAITGQYTAVVGYHAETFQVLAGARGDATYLKLAGTTGSNVGLQYFGDIGVRFSEKASLSAAAWAPTPYGDKRWGAEVYLSGHTDKSEYSQGSDGETKIQTGYLSLRAEVMELDACAAHSGDCVDVPDYRAWSFILGFGAVYQ